jgi:hypothetical protein
MCHVPCATQDLWVLQCCKGFMESLLFGLFTAALLALGTMEGTVAIHLGLLYLSCGLVWSSRTKGGLHLICTQMPHHRKPLRNQQRAGQTMRSGPPTPNNILATCNTCAPPFLLVCLVPDDDLLVPACRGHQPLCEHAPVQANSKLSVVVPAVGRHKRDVQNYMIAGLWPVAASTRRCLLPSQLLTTLKACKTCLTPSQSRCTHTF